ncbi:unnamed protein product [Euphydryas editha]|uniref:Death domain-containing protein n=1 Tax=Euphydryas editha TaxID=104508 RepID=A0AAU9UAU4_EUPED|nr:unnamed protein product [Euphydryas editha]
MSMYMFRYFFLISFTKCILDMNNEQLKYIANHLSEKDCRRLIASLHFSSFELPKNVSEYETKIPEAVPCIDLLLQYSNGNEPWQGENKTHEQISRRLRQIGKKELADWVGKTVFHQFAKDINDTLLQNPFAEYRTQSALNTKLLNDKDTFVENEWDNIDIVLWMALVSLLASLAFSSCRILYLSCFRIKRRSTNEEMRALLK